MKKILFLLIAFSIFSIFGLFVHHFYTRSDDMSLRYNLWKIGLHPLPSDIIWSLHADPERSSLIRGKTKQEIKEIFPDAHEGFANKYQENYEKWDIKGREHLWLGESYIIIFLENGVGKEMTLMKG